MSKNEQWDPADENAAMPEVPKQLDSGSKMKAAQWDPAQNKVVVNNVVKPDPDEGQILIKLGSASLCHSDLMSIRLAGRKDPITLGHEGAGYVEKLHPSTEGKGFNVGDAVGFLYVQHACFECRGCLVHNNHCLTKQSHVNGFTIPGFFSEYAVVDWQNCIKLPNALPVTSASVIFCAGVTAFHTVDSCELQKDSWLIIVGCGGLGQLAIQYGKAMGAKVIAMDINDAIIDVAKTQGADHVFNSRTNKNYQKEILSITDGGAHAVAVYSDADAAYDSAIPLVTVGGILMVVGLPANPLRFGALDIARGTYRVKGDSTSTPQRLKKAVDFTAKHGITPEIETYKSLDDVNGMVEKMMAGQSTKRMVVAL